MNRHVVFFGKICQLLEMTRPISSLSSFEMWQGFAFNPQVSAIQLLRPCLFFPILDMAYEYAGEEIVFDILRFHSTSHHKLNAEQYLAITILGPVKILLKWRGM